MTDEQFFELCERLRSIESRLFAQQEKPTVLIQQLAQRTNTLFDKIHANIPGSLSRRIVQRIRTVVLLDLDKIKTQMEEFFEGSDFATGVDFLITYVRGNLGKVIPWYLAPFVSEAKLLDGIAAWLKSNRDMFKDGIGALPPSVSPK